MAGLEIAGLALAVLGTLEQVIDLCEGLHDRCQACRANPHNLQTLIQKYRDFQQNVTALRLQYEHLSPHLAPPNRAFIEGHMDDMRTLFRRALRALNNATQRINRCNRIRNFFRAASIANECTQLSQYLSSADLLLSDVNIVLSQVKVTVDESRNIQKKQSGIFRRVLGDLNRNRTNSNPLSAVDQWQPSSLIPANPGDIVLDFDAKDSRNFPSTTEARVKALLLERGSCLPITIAMTGMSGVGKSCVLRALPHHPEIKQRFPDGFYFLSLGMDAHRDTIINQAINIVRITGGHATALAMQKFPKVDNVLEKAAVWFQDKTWLLLVDDICDGNGVGSETLSKLLQVLAAGRNSAIVFTTRDAQIAVQGTTHVQFEPKDPLSVESRRILLKCADFGEEQVKDNTCEEAIRALLKKCSGLPVALAIVGRYVGLQALTLRQQRSKAWLSSLNTLGDSVLIRDGLEDYPELSRTFSAALRVLEECKNTTSQRGRSSFKPNQTYTEIHRALCVLRKQGWIPLSVLRILWDLETVEQAGAVARTLAEVNLVDINMRVVDGEEVEGIVLHDLIHKFACDEANDHHETAALHNNLLNRISSFHDQETDEDRGCRQWWIFLPNDGYMFANLSWHLIHAEKTDELLRLLLCPEWTAAQMEVGGYLQLESDFTRLMKHVEANPGVVTTDSDTLKSLQTIVEAVLLSSAYVFSNPFEIWFQLHARLSKRAATSPTIATFLAYIERSAETPWIKPVNDCLTAPGGALKCLITHRAQIRCIDTLPDDDKLVCGCGDGSILVLNTRAGIVTQKWQAHEDPVTSIVTAVHGTRVVSCSKDNTIKVWNAATGTLIVNPVWVPDSTAVLALSPDDRTVLSAGENESVTIWDAASCQFIREVRTTHHGRISALAVSPSGTCAVSGGEDGTVQIWNTETGEAAKPAMVGHSDHVLSVAISEDGKRVVSGSKDGTARIWNARTSMPEGAPLNIDIGSVTCVAITKDAHGDTFVITGSSDTLVRLWNIADQESKAIRLRGHGEEINDLTLSSSGDRVVSCSNDGLMGSVRAWDIETAKKVGSSVAGHSMSVKSLAATPDGRYVVSGSGDKTVRIWDVKSGEQVGHTLEEHTSWVSGVAVTGDGNRVVSVSYDKTIRIWDFKSGRQIGEPLRGHESAITCLALLPDGETLVTGSYKGGTIRLWDISDKRRGFRTLHGHTRQVLCVYISRDAKRIISGSHDQTIRVWDIKSRKCIRVIPHQDCFRLSRKEVMSRAEERERDGEEGVLLVRCRDNQIVRDRNAQVGDREVKEDVLATMEWSISSWVMVGKTLCVGSSNGQVAFLEVQTCTET